MGPIYPGYNLYKFPLLAQIIICNIFLFGVWSRVFFLFSLRPLSHKEKRKNGLCFFRAFSSGSISGWAQTGQFVTVMTEQEMCPPTEYGPVGHFGTLWYESSISTFN